MNRPTLGPLRRLRPRVRLHRVRRLWALQKKRHTIECKVRYLDPGLDLVLLIDDELHRPQLYAVNNSTDLYRDAADTKVAWHARGWTEYPR